MLRRLKRRFQRWSTKWVSGERFKRYTKPNPPSEPGARLRIAVCYLIPLLGDVVMLFPLLDALRREQPDAEIVAFVAGQGRLLRMHPGVDSVYERPRRMRFSRHLGPAGDVASLRLWWWRELRGLRFDMCVMLRGGFDPTFATHLAWLLGGRERVGYSAALEPERNESTLHASPLLTREIAEVNGVHEVERGAEVLRLAGLLSGPVDIKPPSPSLRAIARSTDVSEWVASFPQLAQPYFILSPGASDRRKEWPEANYAAVARDVSQRGWLPVLVGGPDACASAERIAAMLPAPVLNLAGRTTVPQLAAVCAGARCFFGNDSGTGHVAGAVGTPAIIISSYARSGPAVHQTSPQRTHPIGPWHTVVQPERPLAPCIDECSLNKQHCVTQVDVPSVLAAFEVLLGRVAATEEVPSAVSR